MHMMHSHSTWSGVLLVYTEVVVGDSTANIEALRGSLGALSVNKLSHIPKLQPISAVYENQ